MPTEFNSNPDKWNRLNHNMNGTPTDGYATCSACMAHENSAGIVEPCKFGPAVKQLLADVSNRSAEVMCEDSGAHP
jgi:hypothetical protein